MSRKQGDPPRDHAVESGDTFYELAVAYYVDGSDPMDKRSTDADAWAKRIADANPGVSATSLQVGQTLKMPAR